MVMATYPPPTEATFAGVGPMKERLRLLARALFDYLDRTIFDRVRRIETSRRWSGGFADGGGAAARRTDAGRAGAGSRSTAI